MSYRVVVPPRAAEGPTAPASAHDLGQKVRAAVAAGVFVTIGGWVVGLVLGLMWWLGFLEIFGVGAPVVGLLITCWLGFRWCVAAASRQWKVDDIVRERVWQIEDQERQAAEAAAAAAKKDITYGDLDHDNDPSTTSDAQRLHLVAIAVLERHCLHSLPVTRDAMEAAGLCSQQEWNAVNGLLKAVGLKRGYTLREDLDFVEAWGIWRRGVRIDGNRAWVRVGKTREVAVDLAG